MSDQDLETIDGFDIPNRELTEEEANRDITLERFQEWHHEVGEDFIDQHSYGDPKVFLGFTMSKYPEYSIQLLEESNKANAKGGWGYTIQDIQHFFRDETGDDEEEKFYTLYADFVNHTKFTKANVNRQLILVMEHYSN